MPIAPSATAAAPAPGVITTAMPRAVAAATSTRSTPTPVRATTLSAGALSSSAWSTRASARTMAPAARLSSASPGVGDEPAVPVEHPGHQRWVDRAQRHHDRQAAGHQACPNVASGTGVTLCQALSRAEAAVGRDDLGVGQRLLDGGVALLPAAHRDQELLGLDDLEVVVAHAVARSRAGTGRSRRDGHCPGRWCTRRWPRPGPGRAGTRSSARSSRRRSRRCRRSRSRGRTAGPR